MKDLFFVNKDMLKTFSEIKEYVKTSTGNIGTNITLINIPLEKGYVYEVYTITRQGISTNGVINSNIVGNNCICYDDSTRGTGVNGGGVVNIAIVRVENDNASVDYNTYVFENTDYSCYARVRKIGIV